MVKQLPKRTHILKKVIESKKPKISTKKTNTGICSVCQSKKTYLGYKYKD